MRRWKICASRSQTMSFKLNITICHLDGLSITKLPNKEDHTMKVQIKWRAPKKSYLPRRLVKKNQTSKQVINSDGCVYWNEDFDHNCKLKQTDSTRFRRWMISLEIHGSSAESDRTAFVLAKLRLDVAEFAGPTETVVKLPVRCCIGGSTLESGLTVKLNFIEFQGINPISIVHPLSPTQLLPSLSSCVRFQNQNDNDMGSSYSESDEDPEPGYRSLVSTNLQIGGHVDDDKLEHQNDENWEEERKVNYEANLKPSLLSLLSWNNRRYGFRDYHPKDEPLLNKANGEDGGDDIDNDRRTHLSPGQSRHDQVKYTFESFEFVGSDRFEIGNWEKRKFVSRDGKLELETEMFLASIDQRSGKASGEGACTVLAIVIADWLHQNPGILPLKCEFDKLISEGSSVWRTLSKEENNKERFSDQHFDLDTVLQAQVRPLMVVPEKSFVGFFELENIPNKLEFLEGAMSFDIIWEELEKSESTFKEQIYIVSWNDHFFVLKVEDDAIHVIDTLGERLSEGCNKAYILKFNRESKVYALQKERCNSKVDSERTAKTNSSNTEENEDNKRRRQLICEGKSCCKEFIKGFLAALPLRELEADIKRGNTGDVPLHHRLQIELQYTTPCNKNSAKQGDQIQTNQDRILGMEEYTNPSSDTCP